jgi:hypothetical protein
MKNQASTLLQVIFRIQNDDFGSSKRYSTKKNIFLQIAAKV